MSTLLETLHYGFIQRALLAGTLLGLLGSYYGCFVVQRRLSFFGSGLSHSALGGVAIGLLAGIHPLAVAVPFTLGVAILSTWLRDKTRLSGDTSIGIFFSLSVALGMILLSLRDSYTVDAFTYLFGSILAVNQSDVLCALGLFILNGFTLPLWRRWSYATFDRSLAESDGLPVRRDDYLLNSLIALTLVIAMKILGMILMTAFLVIPPATARLVSKRFSQMTLLSCLLGVFTTLGGLLLSYLLDFPSGATIVMVQGFLFLVFLFIWRIRITGKSS